MKAETGGVAIKEFVGMKAKTCSFLVEANSNIKKQKL